VNNFEIEDLPFTIYLASKDYQEQLIKELGEDVEVHDRLIIGPINPSGKSPIWAQDVWYNPVKIHIPSITQAAKALRSLGKNWVLFPVAKHRRAALIQEQLPKFQLERIEFPQRITLPKFGCWSLIDDNTILVSTNTYKNFPLGQYEFVENKELPPNRAYLKLWEIFTSLDLFPKQGERCLDLGSSPGGWTWVLQSLGAEVISVDKAGLDPKIQKLPSVQFIKQSAFALDPQDVGHTDWFFSDIICYPEKLYQLIMGWLEAGVCKNFVCTLKFQGDTDFNSIQKFQEIPGAHLLHLYHNKHEVMFFLSVR